jgi:hypothetical protein
MPCARHCKVWAKDGQGLAVFSTIGNLNRDPAYLFAIIPAEFRKESFMSQWMTPRNNGKRSS